MAWDVFDLEGVLLGELRLPAMHLIHVAEDGIAGVVYDELGVETVRVHPLSRGESSGVHLADPGI